MAEPTWLDEGVRERIRIECLTIESAWENTKNGLIALFNVYANEYCAAGAPDGDAGPLEQIPVLVFETAVSRRWLRDRPVQHVRGPARRVKRSDGRMSLLPPSPVAVPDEALTVIIGKYPVRPDDLEWFQKILFRPTRVCQAKIGRMRIGVDEHPRDAPNRKAQGENQVPQGRRKIEEIIGPGIDWKEAEIAVSDDELQITVRGATRKMSFLEAGFGKRDQSLEIFKHLAASRGMLHADTFTLPKQSKTPLKSLVSRLRRFLQNLIPIEGNPIDHHRKAGMYKCSFRISNFSENSFPTPDGVNWLDFSFHERKDGRLQVSVSARHSLRSHATSRGPGDTLEKLPQPEHAVSRTHSFADLGLCNSAGALTREGTAFRGLLRGRGRLEAKGDDMAILKLADRLRTWTGLDALPLRFAENLRLWTTEFECESELAPRE